MSTYPGLDGDTAQRIALDVGQARPMHLSSVEYGPVEVQFRMDMEAECGQWLTENPGGHLYIPGDDLPDANDGEGPANSEPYCPACAADGSASHREHGDPERDDYAAKYHPGTGKAIPRAQINFVVDRFHVSTPDAEITADIQRRIEGQPDWTQANIDEAIRYALKRHHGNREMYEPFKPRALAEHGDPERDTPSEYRAKHPSGRMLGAELSAHLRAESATSIARLATHLRTKHEKDVGYGSDRTFGELKRVHREDHAGKIAEHGDPTRGSDYRAKYHPGTLSLDTTGDWYEAPDGGLGQVVPSDAPASPVEEAAATLRRKQQDFNRQGGRVHEVKSMADGEAINMRITDMAEVMPEGWFDDLGTKFTRKALDSRRYGNHVLVAYDGDGISGALSWMDMGSDFGLEVLGSTGITDGTGSALTAAILRMAAAQGKGVRLDPLGDALPFWTTVGMHSIPSRDAMFPGPLYGLSADEVRDLAGKLTDA
jgi:hypothetical protein